MMLTSGESRDVSRWEFLLGLGWGARPLVSSWDGTGRGLNASSAADGGVCEREPRLWNRSAATPATLRPTAVHALHCDAVVV